MTEKWINCTLAPHTPHRDFLLFPSNWPFIPITAKTSASFQGDLPHLLLTPAPLTGFSTSSTYHFLCRNPLSQLSFKRHLQGHSYHLQLAQAITSLLRHSPSPLTGARLDEPCLKASRQRKEGKKGRTGFERKQSAFYLVICVIQRLCGTHISISSPLKSKTSILSIHQIIYIPGKRYQMHRAE